MQSSPKFKVSIEHCLDGPSTSAVSQFACYQTMPAGEEVFDSYGCNLSPSDLLLDYGFVDPHNTNHRTLIDPYEIGVLP